MPPRRHSSVSPEVVWLAMGVLAALGITLGARYLAKQPAEPAKRRVSGKAPPPPPAPTVPPAQAQQQDWLSPLPPPKRPSSMRPKRINAGKRCVIAPEGKGTGCNGNNKDYYCLFDNGPSPVITTKIRNLGSLAQHTTYEQGTGGDCLYCSLAAGLNERNRMIGSEERVSMQEVRKAIADSVFADDSIDDDTAIAALEQDQNFDELAHENPKQALFDSITTRKHGTELDLKHFVSVFADVGVITFNGRTGEVYRIDPDEGRRKHYILVLWDYAKRVGDKWDDGTVFEVPEHNPQHYRNLAFQDSQSKEFRFVYSCHDLPWYVQDAVELRYFSREIIKWCE